MRSEAGSVKKYKINNDKQTNSPGFKKQPNKDPRMEYFDMGDHNDMLPRNKVTTRANSGSLQKRILQKKIGLKRYFTG